ncbi:hypothetical protein CROQUDRAFT_102832 [Cronartium quercuum f. sp. fusiforme G11]|uniref:Retrotransposon gag domain-containing protein n=1 Tax=Cronartium quercuum f. sp. fusiforme G11 TaxID=708437 RepID=A0A9P6NU59_9BASI|nr:hypothetical protein CROQUDRAFT_102832 [Cronartium quercuum f. sp. fusiforme G11]
MPTFHLPSDEALIASLKSNYKSRSDHLSHTTTIAAAKDIKRLTQKMTDLKTQLATKITCCMDAEGRLAQIKQSTPPVITTAPKTTSPGPVPAACTKLILTGIHVKVHAALLNTDKAKVIFALFYLIGNAVQWAQPCLQRVIYPSALDPVTFLEFTKAFATVFFNSDRQTHAQNSLQALKKTFVSQPLPPRLEAGHPSNYGRPGHLVDLQALPKKRRFSFQLSIGGRVVQATATKSIGLLELQ